jgi:ACS family hexuronate transporter-like MFS transporter
MEAFISNKASRMRWVMIGMAFLATLLNYIHRLSFTFLSADGDLRKMIPDSAFGNIAAAFFIAYTISNAFSGYVIDKLGTRIGYSLCMAVWTTAGLFHAFVVTPFQFGVVRFMLGIGEAGNWPAGLKLTSEWFPPHERSTASGIFNSGSALGVIIVPPLVAFLSIKYGWQSTFIILALLGYLWLVVFWFLYYTPDKTVAKSKARIIPPLKLFKTRFVSTFALSKFFLEPIWYFITFWIGRYLADVHHWKLSQIGFYAILPFLMADTGNLAGGYFTQYIIKRGMPIHKARKLALCLSGSLMSIPLLLAPFIITSPVTALIVFGISGFGYTSYTSNSLACPADIVPPSATATVWGLGCIGTGLGAAIFNYLSGKVLSTESLHAGYTIAYNHLFVGYGALAFIGILVIIFLMGPLTKNEELFAYVEARELKKKE